MKNYSPSKIRNVAVLGHQGCGKTSLTEALLFTTGAIKRVGRIEDGSTVSDYTKEEKERQVSISTALLPIEWHDHKYNFLDTPGYFDFVGEVNSALRVARGAVIVMDASGGIEVGTEKAWEYVQRRNLPSVIFVNKMDKENVNFDKLLEEIREKFGKRAVPFCIPIGKEEAFEGFVNVVDMKARIYDGNTCNDAEIWPEKMDRVNQLHDMIVESVAETSEELMEKYFDGVKFTPEEIHSGLRKGILEGELVPVLVGSALKNVGTHTLLDMIWDYLPAPVDMKKPFGVIPGTEEQIEREISVEEPFSAIIFKTISDPFIGKINLFKVRSGSVKRDQEVLIANKDKKEKMGLVFMLRGKEQLEVKEISAGDIGAVAKMQFPETGDTLCDPKAPIQYRGIPNPQPTLYKGIETIRKADEDKISDSLHKIMLEDLTFVVERNRETKQQLIGGQGITQLEVIKSKLHNTYGVEVNFYEPKVIYRETIRGKSDVQGKHKKQTGGAGQYGDVRIRFEPTEEPFEFVEKVFGGSVPKNYIPAVEKGLKDCLNKGVLAGYPVIGLRATLYDGSYHNVDSSEMAFRMAATLAFKKGVMEAKPVLLEPVMKIDITIPEDYMGDVMGDINKRRGRVMGMASAPGGKQVVTAEVPQAELLTYTIDLKSMTQARGSFTMEFVRYEDVPMNLAEKIIEQAKEEEE